MKITFTIAFLLLAFFNHGQKLELATGMAFPDTFNFSVRSITQGSAFGIAYGFLPGYDESLRTFSLDGAILYGKNFKKVEAKRSQLRLSLMFYREETEKNIFKHTYLAVRAGRNYLITNQFGFGIEYGLALKIADTEERKPGFQQVAFDYSIEPPVLPSLAIRTFYRLE